MGKTVVSVAPRPAGMAARRTGERRKGEGRHHGPRIDRSRTRAGRGGTVRHSAGRHKSNMHASHSCGNAMACCLHTVYRQMLSGSRRLSTARAGCVFPDAAGLLFVASLLAATPLIAAPAPEKVQGPASCAECHPQEIEAWKTTKHFKSLHLEHRSPEAAQIIAKLAIQPMKAEASCVACHYLTKSEAEGPKIVAIACESCHGAAAGWIKVHGDYGVGVKKETESAEHRAKRRAESLLAGMIVADDVYALGRNCYSCHVLTDEKMANVGGHSVGTEAFSLVSW